MVIRIGGYQEDLDAARALGVELGAPDLVVWKGWIRIDVLQVLLEEAERRFAGSLADEEWRIGQIQLEVLGGLSDVDIDAVERESGIFWYALPMAS